MHDDSQPQEFLTVEIFEEQGWTRNIDVDDETGIEFDFWTLNLPKDNPDPNPPYLISNRSDEVIEGLEQGEYVVNIANFFGLGICETREDVENLYYSLTGVELSEHI